MWSGRTSHRMLWYRTHVEAQPFCPRWSSLAPNRWTASAPPEVLLSSTIPVIHRTCALDSMPSITITNVSTCVVTKCKFCVNHITPRSIVIFWKLSCSKREAIKDTFVEFGYFWFYIGDTVKMVMIELCEVVGGGWCWSIRLCSGCVSTNFQGMVRLRVGVVWVHFNEV